MKITIDTELSVRAKRIMLALGIPAIVLGGGAVAYASVKHTFTMGDKLSAQFMNDNFVDLDARLAKVEGVPECPPGYLRDMSAPKIVLCKKDNDEVVRVGTGNVAFWIDRYEASVWSDAKGTTGVMKDVPYGNTFFAPNYPSTFPKNGQVVDPANLLYAVSRAGVAVSVDITWFQAALACEASGKRLPTGNEWLRAARGTPDPGSSDGSAGACLTNAATKRNTGATNADMNCARVWGAQDLIGNIEEWTAEWYASVGGASDFGVPLTPWPASYAGDVIYNIVSAPGTDGGASVKGLPAAGVRGGGFNPGFNGGTRAGVFYLNLNLAPSFQGGYGGFRCMIPR